MRTPEYEAYPGVSNSFMSTIYSVMHWGQPGLSVNDSILLFGTLFHESVLEPDLFDNSSQGIEGEWLDRLRGMRDATLEVPEFARLLADRYSQIERQRFGVYRGHNAKCIVDLKNRDVIVDLKSTSCRSRKNFISKMVEYGYHRQALMYRVMTGASEAIFLAVEKNYPFQTYWIDMRDYPGMNRQAIKDFNKIFTWYNRQDYATKTRIYES